MRYVDGRLKHWWDVLPKVKQRPPREPTEKELEVFRAIRAMGFSG